MRRGIKSLILILLFSIQSLSYGYYLSPEIQDEFKVPVKCQADEEELIRLMSDYQYAVRANLSRQVEDRDSIFKILSRLEASKDICFDYLAQEYVLFSLWFTLNSLGANSIKPAVILAKNSKLLLLTPQRRVELGGIWSEVQKNGKWKVLAAYDCESSSILVDPYLPIYDMGSALFHELSHVFRDKLVSVPNDIDIQSWIVLDEMSASASSAFLQRKLSALKGNSRTYFMGRPIQVSKYKTKEDLTLHNRRGHLSQLIKENFDDSMTLSNFFSAVFYKSEPLQSQKTKDHLKEITKIISRSYFDQSKEDEFSYIAPSRIQEPLAFYSDLGSNDEKKILEINKKFEQSLNSPSAACRIFNSSVKNGQLKKYIGSKASFNPKLSTGTDGIRPGLGAVKLCIQPDEKL